MKSGSFLFPMKRSEAVAGWIYLFLHTFGLAYGLLLLSAYVLPQFGIYADNSAMNVAYYAIGMVFVLTAMFRFMRQSFSDLCDNFTLTLVSVILGYVIYTLAMDVLQLLLAFFLSNLTNPNSEIINAETKLNPNVMIVVGVIFAPIVEEVLFRGVAFGTIRKTSRFLAYAVSTFLFAAYHLWDFFITDYDPSLFLYLLQYVPAGIVLGWCYEKSRNIWGPVFLHMAINLISVYYTVNGG